MKTYPLAEGCIEISPAREAYNKLRLKYLLIAENAKLDFISQYDQRFKNIDQLQTDFQSVAIAYIEKAVDASIRDLIEKNICDINDSLFSEEYLAPYSTLVDDFSKVVEDKYLEIVLSSKDLDEHRRNQRENRPSIIGGGFGVEGAVQGVAVATAANIALSTVYGVANATGNLLSSIGDSLKKQELFKNQGIKIVLAESIYRNVFDVHLAFVDALKEHSTSYIIEKVSDNDSDKASCLLENINKGRIDGTQAKECLITAINLNPYNTQLYECWLERFGDTNKQLEAIAENFMPIIVICDAKMAILQRHHNSLLPLTSTDKCNIAISEIERHALFLGLDENEITTIKHNILSAKQNIENAPRTFRGVLYESEEAAHDAEERWTDELNRTAHGVTFATMEEAKAERAKKHVGFLFALSIVINPLPNALITLFPGYSRNSRFISLTYMLAYWLLITFDNPQRMGVSVIIFLLGVGILIVRLVLELIVDTTAKYLRNGAKASS